MTPPRPVIIGTGIAGLWTAWRLASEGRRAVVLTKETLADSASAWAQGGIAVALGPGDSPSQHAADTMAASDGLADPEAVRILTSEGPGRIYELLALGARFDRGPDGRLRFGLEAAHTRPRIIHAGGDRTGAALIGCLAQVVRSHPQVELMEHTEVTAVLVADGRAAGVAVLASGEARVIPASAVVLATGGVGQLYAITTNPKVATADGWALAHRAGAQLRDLEFLQFHPTALKLPGINPAPLISEAVRGAGAILVDRDGHRFALDADPRGELAPRDVVARAVAAADATGGA
ncbi:MAG TPA: FAD-dependent oxidoreductase, partial [Gemmatimonadales bacterium]